MKDLFTLFILINFFKHAEGLEAKLTKKNFRHFHRHRLKVVATQTKEHSNEILCTRDCLKKEDCYSFNTKATGNNKILCEFLNTSKYRNYDNLTKDDEYTHWFLEDACSPSPCKHGTCVNDKSTDYRCKCPVGIAGKQCDAPDFSYVTLGCFQDRASFLIAPLEGKDQSLDGHYKNRVNAIEKCYDASRKRGYKMFAIQDGGLCATASTAIQTFNMDGSSLACKSDGKGGLMANQVYYIKDYITMGCYKDTLDRAIQTMEGADPILDGIYWHRKHAIVKCAVAARKAGYDIFALQHGGGCQASDTAKNTFDKHGKSSDCHPNGRGGYWANEVYFF